MDDFAKCVKMRKKKDSYSIECRLGLWGIEAETRTLAENDARHYFEQYREAGEYHEILGGSSPADLIKNLRNSKKVV